ncbi:MAG: 4Fe-4S dicluster domain-containing protein [Anaerolineae bacterium]|nr:4Fe-4S dicluster domain-containing protein [Anaerolineae bacterium]
MSEQDASGKRRWTMIVDLDKCSGCGACVVACHAENNVPIAAEDQVVADRSQHWMRIERYWEGEYPDVKARFVPVLCQHCGEAPCEPVCPVYATYHDERGGLNAMIYARCVGTRYCANNCPYRVRFFNYFDPVFAEPLNNQLNPDVTVRSAGVMEKCTFCVQRIRRAEHTAKVEGRTLADGEVLPACVQACPTGALMFGDRYDAASAVAKLLEHNGRAVRLLETLGTDPSIYYLKGGTSHVD